MSAEMSMRDGYSAWFAVARVIPLVLVLGVLGSVVAGQGAVDDASAAFFYLIDEGGTLFVAAFIVLAVALVCSSATARTMKAAMKRVPASSMR